MAKEDKKSGKRTYYVIRHTHTEIQFRLATNLVVQDRTTTHEMYIKSGSLVNLVDIAQLQLVWPASQIT